MSNKELYIRLTLLTIDFVFMLLVDEKPLKLMSGVSFIILLIGTLGTILI